MDHILAQVKAHPQNPSFQLSPKAVADIKGLPDRIRKKGIDLSSGPMVVEMLSDNKAQALNLNRGGPLRTDEPEGRVFPAWNDWSGNIRGTLEFPIGRDEAINVHLFRLAANNASA